MNEIERFQHNTEADVVEQFREEGARVCEETAKMERGERGPLRAPTTHGIRAEFCDEAFGVAAEVVMEVNRGLKKHRRIFTTDMIWDVAARLLRAGWKRGDRLVAQDLSRRN